MTHRGSGNDRQTTYHDNDGDNMIIGMCCGMLTQGLRARDGSW